MKLEQKLYSVVENVLNFLQNQDDLLLWYAKNARVLLIKYALYVLLLLYRLKDKQFFVLNRVQVKIMGLLRMVQKTARWDQKSRVLRYQVEEKFIKTMGLGPGIIQIKTGSPKRTPCCHISVAHLWPMQPKNSTSWGIYWVVFTAYAATANSTKLSFAAFITLIR